MLKMKNVLKLSAGVIFASAFACQAFAEDIELTGTYGNYLKAGCGWSQVGSSDNYAGPGKIVTVETFLLRCNGAPTPEVVKSSVSYYDVSWAGKTLTNQTCDLYSYASSAVGTCANHRIYK